MGCLKLTYDQTFPLLKVTHSDFSAKEKKMNRFFLSEEKSSAGKYRYSFNGMEKDDEVKGQSNSYTTEFRQYDPRLGRWLSTDPITHAMYSPYSAFDNNPIYWADPSGADSEKDGDPVKIGSSSTETTVSSETKYTLIKGEKQGQDYDVVTTTTTTVTDFTNDWVDKEGNVQYTSVSSSMTIQQRTTTITDEKGNVISNNSSFYGYVTTYSSEGTKHQELSLGGYLFNSNYSNNSSDHNEYVDGVNKYKSEHGGESYISAWARSNQLIEDKFSGVSKISTYTGIGTMGGTKMILNRVPLVSQLITGLGIMSQATIDSGILPETNPYNFELIYRKSTHD